MSEVVWEDPPLLANGIAERRAHRVATLTPLMDHPKRWARVSSHASRGAANTTRRNLVTHRYVVPPGLWEFTTRSKRNDHFLYARYLGPDE